jgi:surface antigen
MIVGLFGGGCSLSRSPSAFADMEGDKIITGSISPTRATAGPSATDLAFARTAASDVLTKGGKDISQPWENPETGARGSVTPIALSYVSEGKTCRDFLASYVQGTTETWLQGAACQTARGGWDIHTLKPWSKG